MTFLSGAGVVPPFLAGTHFILAQCARSGEGIGERFLLNGDFKAQI